MTYAEFFQTARDDQQPPYPYQCRLAGGETADPNGQFTHGTDCPSRLINIPTGLGKTAAVVLAWLWNRVHLHSELWPRRLVYCLPMRTLVEQTRDEVQAWTKKLLEKNGLSGKPPRIVILMGGEDSDPQARDWDIYPEENAILIGTQDMLLSRALNRGYGMSRYRWPMHFALLNNDCLWVMDETQLMGVAVETSAQLDGFRNDGKMSLVGKGQTWWMSATLEDSRLETVDHPAPTTGWPRLELSTEERDKPGSRPRALFEARKAVSRCDNTLSPGTKSEYAKAVATLAATKHTRGTLTLIVVNRVKRAQEIYEALVRPDKRSKQPLYDPTRTALIHSRFRRTDRRKQELLLSGEGDRIVVATQAVEAGVDVSARLLITELAPWTSIVQRIGRCNRRADRSDGEVIWVDIEPDAKGELVLPYTKLELDQARSVLSSLTDASPRSISGIHVAVAHVVRPVIRRRDLVDLFDTTPDICGQDLDVSRYIRDGEDSDVQFFWRTIDDDSSVIDEPPPVRDELCRVSISDAARFLGKKARTWRWNPLDEQWEPTHHARPGSIYLVDAQAGGYDDAFGWTGDTKDKPTTHKLKAGEPDRYWIDRLSLNREWETLAEHTALVAQKSESIVANLGLAEPDASAIRTAAIWHDVGKAHPDFQKMLRDGPHDPGQADTLYAKSKNPPRPLGHSKNRSYRIIRHELASALAWLLQSPADADNRDLVAYLIAAHHGKVRLSIRSLPAETGDPNDPERLFARGIWQGDKLPAIHVNSLAILETTLDLSFMRMGDGPHGPSWLARTIAVRDRLGPFRLALLETLLRAADARASAETEH